MAILEIEGLCKHYPGFSLQDVSFSLEEGRIAGFIGRNGAGKTTTLKSMLNMVHPDAGSVRIFGMDFAENEGRIKQQLGFVGGGAVFYPKKKLKTITAVTRGFYTNWDGAAYLRYLSLFALDENKTPEQLSAGMKVKYVLALALSHHARLLVLDEPTSGLDPVSRSELQEIFLELASQGVSILFSTHITSDLEQCADDIIYIRGGRICAAAPLEQFRSSYLLARGEDEPDGQQKELLLGLRREKQGFSALLPAGAECDGLSLAPASLEDIMVHLEKEGGSWQLC